MMILVEFELLRLGEGVFDYKRALASVLETHPDDELIPLYTKWGKEIDPDAVLLEYPRPQMVRLSYENLNGWWDYAIQESSDEDLYAAPQMYCAPDKFDGRILVPFSPETLLSSVNKQLQPHQVLWYRRALNVPTEDNKRFLLHFEAVDFDCSVFIDECFVGAHQGGYAPFCIDITEALIEAKGRSASEVTLAVAVKDPSEHGVQPRGKQRIDRGTIWCTAQSGIWQTVWLEAVPEIYIDHLHLLPDAQTGKLRIIARVVNASHANETLSLNASVMGSRELNEPPQLAHAQSEEMEFAANSSCVCDLELTIENPHLWCPEDPHLYNLKIGIGSDRVSSYCAFRTFSVELVAGNPSGKKVICLNHKPLFLKGVLDQGYWPDGLLTAPSDEALVFDIELAKQLGFNMMRKHLKSENARWYYHCDRLGMIVWQDMVNGGAQEYSPFYTSQLPTVFPAIANHLKDTHDQKRFGIDSDLGKRLWLQTSVQMVEHLRNYPCIAGWTVFNEAWGQFDSIEMTAALRILDDTRLFDQTSGWCDQGGGDLISEHNYFRDILVPKARFIGDKRAPMISEFGGYAYYTPNCCSALRAYGYAIMETEEAFKAEVTRILDEANALEPKGLAGYVYTQLTDVEEEVNGLATYDRSVIKL